MPEKSNTKIHDKKVKYILLFLLMGLMVSCSTEKVKTTLPPVSKFIAIDDLDRITLDGSPSSDPNQDILYYTWSTPSDKIVITADATASSAHFRIPASNNGGVVTITLKVNDQTQENVSTQSINFPALTQVRSYGLGRSLMKELSNNDDYEWYLDQGVTGRYSGDNCGPTAVTMAIKWSNQDFQHTPEDARNMYRATGGPWYTTDISQYLDDNRVSNWTIPLDNMGSLKYEIDHGFIAILCLDMYYVTFLKPVADAEYRKDKFYENPSTGAGHFLIIKGYKEVDGKTFYEVYDPNNWGSKYSDLTPKGKDRYYASEDLDLATQNWFDYAIIVSKTPFSGGRRVVNNHEILPKPGL